MRTREPWEELFFQNAFFLYEHKDSILADSRMAYTPLPFRNNLAYTGTSGLRDATLGVYMEWWDACEKSVLKAGNGIRALTYFIAGSPLSGSNSCGVVTKAGKTKTVHFPSPFYEIWGPFAEINRRYAEAKQQGPVQAYTLEETIAILRERGDQV